MRNKNNKHEIDISLICTNSLVGLDTKASILEKLLKEENIKYEKFYSSVTNRTTRSKTCKYIPEENKIILFEIYCAEENYGFIMYLLKSRLNKIETLNKSLDN